MSFTIAPIAVDAGYGEAILSLAGAKVHLRIEQDSDDEDDLIAALRDAAIDFVEQYTNVRLGRVTGEARLDARWTRVSLGIGPIGSFSVTGIRYRTVWDSEPVEIAPGSWFVDSSGFISSPSGAWPQATVELIVAFEAGYAAGHCPPALIAAVKLMLGHLYANRESVVTGTTATELPLGVKALCERYRMPVL